MPLPSPDDIQWIDQLSSEVENTTEQVRALGPESTDPDSPLVWAVASATRAVASVTDFVTACEAAAENFATRELVSGEPPFLRRLIRELSSIRVLLIAAREPSDVTKQAGTAKALQEAAGNLDDALQDAIGAFAHSDWSRQRLAPIHERTAARTFLSRAERAASSAEGAADAAKRSAGVAAETTLGAEFAVLAEAENRVAQLLRVVVGVLLVALVAFGVLENGASSFDWDEVPGHLGVAVPVGVLAAYLAQLSAGHLRVARWAGTLAVQLRSVDGYVERMEPKDASALRAQLGARAYVGSPPDTTSDDGIATPTAEIVPVAQSLAEIAETLAFRSGLTSPVTNSNGTLADAASVDTLRG